jgi:hypothetical protein
MNNRFLFCTTILIVTLLCAGQAPSARAATIMASVTYIGGDLIFLDAGRAQGVDSGMTGEVRRDSLTICFLRIVAVSDHSSSAQLSEIQASPVVGDWVTVNTPDTLPHVSDILQPDVSATPTQTLLKSTPTKARRKERRVTGRVALQWYAQDDRLPQNYDITQPSAVTRLRIRSLFAQGVDLSLRLRSRRNFYSNESSSRSHSDWDHRYYELDLSYKDPNSDWEAHGGRILVGSIGGIGYLDGAYLQYQLQRAFYLGTFAGSQPDLTTTEFRSDTRKGGVCLIWKPTAVSGRDLGLTTALAGEYSGSEINREFIYQQFNVNTPSGFSVYQSADVNVNRGWKAKTEHSTLVLSNVMVNAHYQPLKKLAVSAGYDGQANYRTWETRETPDSLFDEAMRRGYRAGLEFNAPFGVRCEFRETVRDDPATTKLSASTSLSAMTHSLLRNKCGLSARYDAFENRFTTGIQSSAGISWTTPLNGDLILQLGQTAFTYQTTGVQAHSEWWRVALDFSISRHWYGSSYYESYVGTSEDVARLFLETGFRF